MSQLDQMEIFYFVATWKSFSRAALELGVSKGYISQQVTALEKDLKVKLLHRSTRHLSLTEEGSLFLESCTKIVHEKQTATDLLKASQLAPSGSLKISAPPSLCSTYLGEVLTKFQKKYPAISLVVDSSSTVKNLLQHGIDLALCITSEPNENYIARVITTFRFVICATSDYLKHSGTPTTPEALLQHNCLVYSADPAQNRWPFQVNNQTEIVSVKGSLASTNCSLITQALLTDQGIARLPYYVVAKEITKKKLQVLFSENTKIEMPIYAVYAGTPHLPPKIKCFVDFLKENMQL